MEGGLADAVLSEFCGRVPDDRVPEGPQRNFPLTHWGVMRTFLAGIFLGIFFSIVGAHADDAPPPKVPEFVPFVVDKQQDNAARQYLNGLTFKDAAPLVAWLNELEARAKAQWEADNKPKPAPEVPK